MEFSHKPVMLSECIEGLRIKPDGVYIDGTLGGAGHSSEILKRLNKNGVLIGIDQDFEALEVAKGRLESLNKDATLIFENTNFKNIKEVCNRNNFEKVDGILLDIGVSSYQLDFGDRGFSYNHDASLDMRMDKRNDLTAEIVVNEYPMEDIRRIISQYGEEKWASRIAKFIVKERDQERITTTNRLVEIIKKAIPINSRREGPHPAKRTFQAIRIEVNKELDVLEEVIGDAIDVLELGGRLCIITFHSLEDRIVKKKFIEEAKNCKCPPGFPVCVCETKPRVRIVSKKSIEPGEDEVSDNHRSRSARLRIVERI